MAGRGRAASSRGGVAMCGQERGQVTRDGRVRRVGQSELLKARLMRLRPVLQGHPRQEPFDQQRRGLRRE